MTTVTVEAYEKAEREIELRGARIGMVVHTVVTVLVCAILVPINIIVAPEFPWSVFVVLGMGFGLAVHWWFGYYHIEDAIRRHQATIEERAAGF